MVIKQTSNCTFQIGHIGRMSRMGTLSERAAFITEQLKDKPLGIEEIKVQGPNANRGCDLFRRHRNPNGSPGGWVHEDAEVARGVTVPVSTIVDAWSSMHGVGTLDNDRYYGMWSYVDFARSSAVITN